MKPYLAVSLLLLLAFLTGFPLHAQKRGNGKAVTQTRSLDLFTKLVIDFPAEVEVVCQELPHLSITIDENLLAYLEIKNRGGELSIKRTEWVQPSTKVHIKIGTAFLHQLDTDSYGTYWVHNLKGPEFRMRNPVAEVELEGEVGVLTLATGTGTIDASKITAREVYAEIWSFGTIKVHATELIDGKVVDNGTLVYREKPKVLREEVNTGGQILLASEVVEEPPEKLQYIELSLKNNKDRKIDVYVQGPKGHRFSYGMPFQSGQVRTETFPVGTRIFLDNILTRKLLVTIVAGDEDKTIDLFN